MTGRKAMRGLGALMAGLLLASVSWAENAPVTADSLISAEALQGDIALLEQAYSRLHGGLYRYRDQAGTAAAFVALAHWAESPRSLEETYLTLSRYLSEIRCSHSYANFWNQPKAVQAALFERADKLPLTFLLQDERLWVTQSLVAELEPGDEVIAIDDRPLAEIWQALLPLVRGDGHNDAQRWHRLNLDNAGRFQEFDVFFPLVFPPTAGQYRLSLADGRTLTVSTVTRAARQAAMAPEGEPAPWRLSWPQPGVALLTLDTFTTWNFERPWQDWLAQLFQRIEQDQARRLIIDIRGNGGGTTAVVPALMSYLVAEPMAFPQWQPRTRFQRVPEALRPHLGSWDPKVLTVAEDTVPDGQGRFRWPDNQDKTGLDKVVPAAQYRFDGEVLLLVDGANASATFLLAQALQQSGRATLLGSTTGGNRRGINGGAILFLNLPGSGIEVDLPLIGYFAEEESPDAGLVPDIRVDWQGSDLTRGRDPVMEAALAWRPGP